MPNRLGIITSPTGSVVYDIINRVNDRFPMPLDIWPVSVQGVDAVDSIITAIEGFNKMKLNKPDVIIIARGGGIFRTRRRGEASRRKETEKVKVHKFAWEKRVEFQDVTAIVT